MPRFHRVVIDVEEVAVGAVMRELHNMRGVVNIHYDMQSISYKANKQLKNGADRKARIQHEVTTQQLVNTLLLKTNKPITSKEAIKRLAPHQRTPSAIYTAFGILRTNGYATGSMDKGYVLTAKGREHLKAGLPASRG